MFGKPMVLPSIPVRPVFVVGMNGSGTTMLAESLGRHPALFSLARETHTIPHLMRVAARCGNLEDDRRFLALWERVRRIHVFVKHNRGRPVPVPANWADFPRTLGAILDANYRYFAEQEGKQRWCEKTPHYVQHMPELLELFPESSFVHIVRDGRACAASFHRRWQRSKRLTMYRWSRVIRMADACAAELGNRYLEVRYEDLVADPRRWMERICTHLDLPFTEAVLASSQPQSDRAGETGAIHAGNVARWRLLISEPELRALETMAGKWLALKGYPILYHEGSSEPNAAQLAVWRTVDYARTARSILAKISRNYSPARTRRLLKRVSVGWWHAWTNKF